MITRYREYLEFLDKKLTKMFEAQKTFIKCKKGCAYCCREGEYPLSELEYINMMLYYNELPDDLKTRVDDNIINLGYDKESDESFSYSLKYNNKSYSGTGDIFTSIISGLITNGHDFKDSIKIASDFIFKCIEYTSKYDIDPNDGVFFEVFLNDLTSLNN